MTPPALQQSCPCGTGETYDACCGRLHRGAVQASTALELMRSRYSAFVLGDTDHLFRTWHPRTRPDDLAPDTARTWTGLEILDVVAGGAEDTAGVVEFIAHYRQGATAGQQHERSSFERRAGRWVYVSG